MKKFRGMMVALLLLSFSAPIVSFADEQSTTDVENVSPIVDVKSISVKDVNLPTGTKWDNSYGFLSVELADGSTLAWQNVVNDIQITGQVNVDVPGVYPLTYTYGGKQANMNVTVKNMEVTKVQNISVKDINLPLGIEWKASDSFNYVELTNGTKKEWAEVANEIKVTGAVDSRQQGTYKVTYQYEDKQAVATVTVKDMEVIKVQEISVKDINLPLGEKWDASQNFNYILLSNGIKLYWKDVVNDLVVTIDDNAQMIDTSKPGTHKVTYTYDGQSVTANVTVGIFEVVKVQQILVKNTTIPLGSKWNTSDNFITVKMSDGTERTWADISKDMKIEGTVDVNKEGVYKVTYKLEDKEATATITVTSKKILPQTGEKTYLSTIMFIVGALLIPLVFIILVIKKRKTH